MQEKETNNLFPVFLKLEKMAVLIVGGGMVGLEKISAILLHAPQTRIKLVAAHINEEIKSLAVLHPKVQLIERLFIQEDLYGSDVVMIAVNDPIVSSSIRDMAKEQHQLVNVADKPDQCDFYMSSIVKKGNLKIAISTNGKSPTIGKRLKALFEDILPNELDEILGQMQEIRNSLKGDFAEKVKKLNELTRDFTPISKLK